MSRPVPRNRTVRLAVLGSSVQRSAASGYPSTRSSAIRRRIVVGGLVLLSLVLITVSFRSSALDGVQGTAADALRPFEVVASRVARPFRDTVGWVHGLVDAKSQNKKLRHQVADLQQQVIAAKAAETQNATLKRLLHYHGPASIADFRKVYAGVIVDPQNALSQSVTIDAGTSAGVAAGDVVITPDGLVGTVARSFNSVSKVTLITDELSAVTAMDANYPTAVGIAQRGNGSSVLVLNLVPKEDKVAVGDPIVTAGTPAQSSLQSMFPRGILVGTVTSESDSDVNDFKNIQIQPSVSLNSLQSVIVLAPRSR
jgi:rod shape-determining protein MreC